MPLPFHAFAASLSRHSLSAPARALLLCAALAGTAPGAARADQPASRDHPQLLREAVALIDNPVRAGDLETARTKLDRIVVEDPSNAQAYLELARIAMKTDPQSGENGDYPALKDARRLIDAALKADPSSANAYVLLGYVHAVRHSVDEAVAAFTKAQQLGTKNMWLYYDWGLAYENLYRAEPAIKKYQEGIALLPVADTPETHSSNRAIPMIFTKLARLLEQKRDIAALDALSKKRLAMLDEPCQPTNYAQFKLYKMADIDAAIALGNRAVQQDCGAGARPVLAAAYLAKWALGAPSAAPAERAQLLDRAREFMAKPHQTVVDVAASPYAAKVLPKLRDAGIALDTADARGMTPLAYAAAEGNKDAVAALIQAGANPDAVLKDGWTPLMIAIAANQLDAVNVLAKAKADLRRKNADGEDAMALARRSGNPAIVEALTAKPRR